MKIIDYLEKYEPEMEEAANKLFRMIREDQPRTEILEMVEYLEEFWNENDPIQMGWVGSDGLP